MTIVKTQVAPLTCRYELPFALCKGETPSFNGLRLLNTIAEEDEFFPEVVAENSLTIRLPATDLLLNNQEAAARLFARVEALLDTACRQAQEHDQAESLAIAQDLV